MAVNISLAGKLVPNTLDKIALESQYILDTTTGKKQSEINLEIQEQISKSNSVVVGTYDRNNKTFSDTGGNICDLSSNKIYIDIFSGLSYFYTNGVLIPEQDNSEWNDVD